MMTEAERIELLSTLFRQMDDTFPGEEARLKRWPHSSAAWYCEMVMGYLKRLQWDDGNPSTIACELVTRLNRAEAESASLARQLAIANEDIKTYERKLADGWTHPETIVRQLNQAERLIYCPHCDAVSGWIELEYTFYHRTCRHCAKSWMVSK